MQVHGVLHDGGQLGLNFCCADAFLEELWRNGRLSECCPADGQLTLRWGELTPQLRHVALHLLVSLFASFQTVQTFLQVLQSLLRLLQPPLQLHTRLNLRLN